MLIACSVALLRCVVDGSADDAYNFYFSSAAVIYVALVHSVEIDAVSTE